MSQKPNNKEDLINALVVKLADTSTLSVKELKDMLTDELYDYSLNLIESTELISVNGSMTDYLFNYFYIGKLSANVQENSLNNYRLTVYQLVNLLGKELNEITSDDIRVFLIRYKQIKGCCDVTMNKKRLVLSIQALASLTKSVSLFISSCLSFDVGRITNNESISPFLWYSKAKYNSPMLV